MVFWNVKPCSQYKVTDVSVELTAFMLKAKNKETGSPNYWQCSTAIHYVTPQNGTTLILFGVLKVACFMQLKKTN